MDTTQVDETKREKHCISKKIQAWSAKGTWSTQTHIARHQQLQSKLKVQWSQVNLELIGPQMLPERQRKQHRQRKAKASTCCIKERIINHCPRGSARNPLIYFNLKENMQILQLPKASKACKVSSSRKTQASAGWWSSIVTITTATERPTFAPLIWYHHHQKQ